MWCGGSSRRCSAGRLLRTSAGGRELEDSSDRWRRLLLVSDRVYEQPSTTRTPVT